ncbi:hypothetical protein IPN35_01180 [Candidatus Peregrinibacteria bacterium]|nr:MAG: hypothetical protein IPN35_01180 [Candidatus Peregrinibacteria bacterium]
MSKTFHRNITHFTDIIFTFLILCSIIALVVFSSLTVFNLFLDVRYYTRINIIHNIVYIIVLLKAYKILTFYLESHNLSIQYLVQISIIAPAIEVIFASEEQSIWLNTLYTIYSLTNLYIYIRFQKELSQLNFQDEKVFHQSKKNTVLEKSSKRPTSIIKEILL